MRARKEADLPVFVEVQQHVDVPDVDVRVECRVLMEREGLASLGRLDVHGLANGIAAGGDSKGRVVGGQDAGGADVLQGIPGPPAQRRAC